MKKIIIDKNEFNSYKEFYEKMFVLLNGEELGELSDFPTMSYSGDMLYEFLWCRKQNNLIFQFINFDMDKIKEEKTLEDYKWNIIFKCLKIFTTNYPNNKIEFVNDKD